MTTQSDAQSASRDAAPLRVAVLSCSALGIAVANRLQALPQVSDIVLVETPWSIIRRSLVGKVRHVYRMQGSLGLLAVLAAKLGYSGETEADDERMGLSAGIEQWRFDNFHSAECRAALREWQPDLGVLAGTYILKESVFGIPRLGTVNLHCGKAPEYRGAAPGFWELYNGETQVGVTVHQVDSSLDAGGIYRQETFPLDSAPAGDPLVYLADYRATLLQPAGVRLLAETVAGLPDGSACSMVQDNDRARTYRSPDHRAIRELRRRVAARRARLRKEQACGKSI